MAENEVKNPSEISKDAKNGKKKAVIAGSIAAGLTAVVAAVTIVSLTRPDLPNEPKSYSIKVSSEFEGFNNSDIKIVSGTKVKDLKTMITSKVEGYEVSGFYQDFACTIKYDPETVITEDMQVFIQFDLKRLTVTAYADTSKTQVLETIEVVYGNDATLATPTKADDKVGKHEFAGWVDSMGRPVSLTNIKADTEVFANFVVTEYVNYAVGEIPSHVTVTKGSGETETTVATGDNLHYGDRVKIVYTPSTGYQMKTFTVAGAEAVDGAENWYTVTGALSVSYSEEKIAYVVGELPKQVTILDAEGNPVASGATLLYDDIITITYTPTAGYTMTEFEVAGAYPVEGLGAGENKYNVRGNITVTYTEEENEITETPGLVYQEVEDGYAVVAYTGIEKDLIIPATHNGKPVTTLSQQMLVASESMTSIIIAISLNSISIPETVTSIGDGMLMYCANLNYISVAENNPVYTSKDKSGKNVNCIINKSTGELLSGCNTSTIPDDGSVTSIGNGAFAMRVFLKSVTIPESVTSIGAQAFSACGSLKSITIPESVTSIGNSAFAQCTGLTSINIPEGVTTVGDNAFQDCTNLISLNLPNSLTSLGQYAFERCSKLTSVKIPESLTSIGSYTFNSCYNLVSVTVSSGITSIASSAFGSCYKLLEIYNLSSLNITAGSSNFGSIGQYAKDIYTSLDEPSKLKFREDGYVMYEDATNNEYYLVEYTGSETNLVLPTTEYDYKIYNNAFRYSYNLRSVTFSNSVTGIENNAFHDCSSLIKVVISEGLTSIGDSAFYNCSSLTSVAIPNSIKSIGSSAFYNCNSLNYNEYEDVLYLGNEQNPFVVLVKVKDTSISTVQINEKTKIIYESAFYNCASITSITIPSSVVSIGSSVFYGCTGLTEINYNAKNVSDFTSSSNIFYNAGTSGTGITVTFGEGVETIPSYLFYTSNSSYSPKIISITLSDGVISIGNYAFYNCTGLIAINIPSSVTSMGNNVFYNCTGLTTITMPSNITSIGSQAFYNCSGLTSITIPSNVTSIGSQAFYNCSGLTSITIPSNVTSIGNSAFYGCNKLTEINYNAKNVSDFTSSSNIFYNAGTSGNGITVTFGEGVESIPAYLFYVDSSSYRPKITSVTIPSSVTSIGSSAFYGCIGLTSITIPEGVLSIGSSAFYGCIGLTTITIPNSITSIGVSAFYNCSKLNYYEYDNAKYLGNEQNQYVLLFKVKSTSITSMQINENTKFIYDSAFSGYTFLNSITIPKGVISIGTSAFSGCTSLRSITIPEGVTNIGKQAFYNSGITSITVAENNSVYTSRDKSGNEVNCIINKNTGELIYGRNDSIIPSDGSIKSIGDYAFYGCTSLRDVNIPEGVTSIGNYAFYNCTYINNIIIPEGVTIIGNQAFYNCSSLTSITIPSSVKSIGNSAFYGCTKLTEINYYSKNLDDLTNTSNVFCNAGSSGTGIIVNFGEGVEKIPEYLFFTTNSSYSPKITSIIIAEGVTSIGSQAFYNCSSLTSITIPSSVKSIGNSAFYGCTKLTEINYNAKNVSNLSYYANVFYNAGNSGTGITVIIGEDVEKIPEYLFYVNSTSYLPKITTIIIESADVYKVATSTSSVGYLLNKATIVRVLASADDGTNTYLNNNFDKTTETIDDKTYNVYTKK